MNEYKQLSKISETSYLNADNAERYRAIMRVFYHADQHYSDSLYKEDIMRLLKEEFPQYNDLSMDQLKLDLAQLAEWKNLEAVQDPRHVYTIAEYKNKKFRYTMTPASVEIERMTIRLESLYLETSSLSSNYFVRLEGLLVKAEDVPNISTLSDIVLLICALFRQENIPLQTYGTAKVPKSEFYRITGLAKKKYSAAWSKAYREMDDHQLA